MYTHTHTQKRPLLSAETQSAALRRISVHRQARQESNRDDGQQPSRLKWKPDRGIEQPVFSIGF